MSFRTRLLLAFGAMVVLPLAVVGFGIRHSVGTQLTQQFRQRAAALTALIETELARESDEIAQRLSRIAVDLQEDNRFRSAVLQRVGGDRQYVLDLAANAMQSSGLAMLQVQDDSGRIISSGHFRNEFDRLEPELPAALSDSLVVPALVSARTPTSTFLALVRSDSTQIGDRWFTIVGGRSVDRQFLRTLAGGRQLAVSLVYPGGVLSSWLSLERRLAAEWTATETTGTRREGAEASAGAPDRDSAVVVRALSDQVVTEMTIPYVAPRSDGRTETAKILVTHPLSDLHEMLKTIDAWVAGTIGVTAIAALMMTVWLSSRLSRPLAKLAGKTSQLDLDRLDVGFESGRKDEIGALSRLLQSMTDRLRKSATRLKEIERRATVGEIARQVNHDIKNGLIPVRNVLRHLQQVAHDSPDQLSAVYRERQATLDSGITHLENLAANYARLYPKIDRRPCQVNEILRQLVSGPIAGTSVRLDLGERLPTVTGDPVGLRRVFENLLANAVDAARARSGTVSVSSRSVGSGAMRSVHVVIADTGHGMTKEQLDKAFEDFYTTKKGGTGLGLSVVRRLVLDMNGGLRVESEPGVGTRFVVELPASSGVGS
jgi:signal transduction histidine kinase